MLCTHLQLGVDEHRPASGVLQVPLRKQRTQAPGASTRAQKKARQSVADDEGHLGAASAPAAAPAQAGEAPAEAAAAATPAGEATAVHRHHRQQAAAVVQEANQRVNDVLINWMACQKASSATTAGATAAGDATGIGEGQRT